jgi:hypothetical protein
MKIFSLLASFLLLICQATDSKWQVSVEEKVVIKEAGKGEYRKLTSSVS